MIIVQECARARLDQSRQDFQQARLAAAIRAGDDQRRARAQREAQIAKDDPAASATFEAAAHQFRHVQARSPSDRHARAVREPLDQTSYERPL